MPKCRRQAFSQLCATHPVKSQSLTLLHRHGAIDAMFRALGCNGIRSPFLIPAHFCLVAAQKPCSLHAGTNLPLGYCQYAAHTASSSAMIALPHGWRH